MDVVIPEALKTTAEKIAWLGDNIRTRLVVLEVLDIQRGKTKEKLAVYEEMVRAITKEEEVKE